MFVLRRTFTHLSCAKEYYKAIQPLFYFTHLLGVTAYVVVTNERGVKSLAISRFSYIVLILILAGFGYCGVYIVCSKSTFIGNFINSDITNSGEKIIILFSCAATMNVLVSNIVGRRQLHWVFKHFFKIDKLFGRIGIQWNYRKVFYNAIWRLIYTVFLISIALIIYGSCFYRLNAYPSLQLFFVMLNVMTVLHFTIFFFEFLIMLTAVKIQALNEVS